MKTCSRCNVTKTFDQFHRDKSSRDGFKSACKACRAAYDKWHHFVKAEEYRERSYAWKDEHPEQQQEHTRKSERRRRAAEGYIPVATRKAFIAATGFCLACGTTKNLTIDHVVPLSKGGSAESTNWQVLCHVCNSRKMTDSTDYRGGQS